MKTTIELPDETLRRAKVFAAERDTTLKELITDALERFLETPSRSRERTRKAALKRLLAEMQASNAGPMKPLTRDQIHDR